MALTARNEQEIAGGGIWTRGLEWEMRQLELEHAGDLPIRRTADAKARTIVRRRMRFPVFTVLGALAAAVLAVVLLMNYIELTRLSTETVALKSELNTLRSDNAVLSAEYDRMFDLASIKARAEAAGMVKPSSSQVSYVDLSGGDTVEIYQQEESGVLNGIVLSARKGFEAVKEYFD